MAMLCPGVLHYDELAPGLDRLGTNFKPQCRLLRMPGKVCEQGEYILTRQIWSLLSLFHLLFKRVTNKTFFHAKIRDTNFTTTHHAF